MKAAIASFLSLACGFLVLGSSGFATATQETDMRSGFASVTAMVVDMRDHWKRYRELADVGDSQSADHLATRMIELRHRAGMLGNTAMARGFAMRAWRQQQAGKLDDAIREFRYAVNLEPAAREYRVALASAIAAQRPMDVFTYIPLYWEALWRSNDSLRGRYLFTIDFSLWLGITLLCGGCLWFFGVMLRYVPALHHTFTEMLATVFSIDIAKLLATVAFFAAMIIGIQLQWILLGIAAACWTFQTRGGKLVSIMALAALWLGTGLISLSSQMTAGMTTTEARAAFAADRFDADETVILELERRIEDKIFTPQGRFSVPHNDRDKLDLFLYAEGIRKLGRTRGLLGLDIMDIFAALKGTDELGRLAAVNLGNIQFEREDIVSAQSNYQFAMQGFDAKPFAQFDLWRLNYEQRNRSAARELWESLIKDERGFARRFQIENESMQPALIDAEPSQRMLDRMIGGGLAAAAGLTAANIDPLGMLSGSIFGNFTWVVAAFAAMILCHPIMQSFGPSVICRTCGKTYCKHCDLDPKASSRCQACNSIKAAVVLLDAELRRSQERRIARHKRWEKARRMVGNILAPGLGSAWAGKPMIAAGLMTAWCSAVAMAYGLARYPRTEVLPFFSHWTFLSGAFILVVGGGAYALAVWHALQEEEK